MSVYVVDNAQIDVIVSGAVNQKMIYDRSVFAEGETSPQALGQILLNENYASYNARYRESLEPEVYVWEGIENAADNKWVVLSAIHGYVYQSCESPNWESSEANRLVQQIEKRIIQSFSEFSEANGWGFSKEDSLGKSRSLFAFMK